MGAATFATCFSSGAFFLTKRAMLPKNSSDFVFELALTEQSADNPAEVEVLVLLLTLPLVFELALAQQSADDAAEVEVLALLLAFELKLRLVLELGLQLRLV